MPGRGDYRRAIIACNSFRELEATGMLRFQQFSAAPWERRDIETGHWPMLSAPRELADAPMIWRVGSRGARGTDSSPALSMTRTRGGYRDRECRRPSELPR